MGWVTIAWTCLRGAAGAAGGWVSAHWRVCFAAAGLIAIAILSTCVVKHCHAVEDAEQAAEAARIREIGAQAAARAATYEAQAAQLGDLVSPLVDAGIAAGAKAEDAQRIEAAQLDAGAGDSVHEILDDLSSVFK